jgi:hypothetical protein
MKEIILLIWSGLVTSGWWAIALWGKADDKSWFIAVPVFTVLLTVFLAIHLALHIVQHWDE